MSLSGRRDRQRPADKRQGTPQYGGRVAAMVPANQHPVVAADAILRKARSVALLSVCRFNPANLSWRPSVGRSTQGPMDRPAFLLFVRAVLPERVPKPRLAGQRGWVVRSHKKSLAVPAFTVQNGHASSSVTRRATTVDCAEIGRISRHLGLVPLSRSRHGVRENRIRGRPRSLGTSPNPTGAPEAAESVSQDS
jgi:hypothetical protein